MPKINGKKLPAEAVPAARPALLNKGKKELYFRIRVRVDFPVTR
jgi:hypothetical protein